MEENQGRYFYGVIVASLLIGLGLNFIGVNPIKALVFAAVFNGMAAIPLIWSRGTLMLTFVSMAISYVKG